MKNLFQTAAAIKKIQTLEDKTLKLSVYTQELNAEESVKLFSLFDIQGYFLFQEAPIKKEDIEIPEIEGEFKKDKTPSQMMRNIIYRIWETTTSRKEAFPDYYKSYMFKLNEMLKEKLN